MSNLFQRAIEISKRMGASPPSWVSKKREPQFAANYYGSGGAEIILLHGLFGAVSNWDLVVSRMKEYCRPVALHFPLLTYPRSDVKVKSLAVYTWYFLQKQNLAPSILCGNSLGGHVALRLCLADPSAVKCLILSGTSGLYEHSVDSLPVRISEEFVREQMLRVFFNDRFVTDEAVKEIYDVIKDKKNVLKITSAARSAKKDYLLEHLSEIKCPVLLLWGEDDEVTNMEVAETFAKHIPNCTLVSVKNCGHAPMIEQPEWFSEQVRIFLGRESLV